MTWVIGRAGPFGYAVGLSDIRITLHDGTVRDCLQKLYKIGSQLVLGFACSVAIGLEIVQQLSTILQAPGRNGAWDPLFVAEMLPIGTKKLFNSFPDGEKALGCELILMSVHPTVNDGAAPWAKCFVHRFFSPEFKPWITSSASIVSIGSGTNFKPYIETLRTLSDDYDMFKLELGKTGASGHGLMASVSSFLRKFSTLGISTHLHICIIGRPGSHKSR